MYNSHLTHTQHNIPHTVAADSNWLLLNTLKRYGDKIPLCFTPFNEQNIADLAPFQTTVKHKLEYSTNKIYMIY
jgi:hypothetical protein